jgi:CheY-like chemotaxis protein
MSEEFLEHIWDSFSQERNKNENSTKGTGLGMSISKMLMDAMGGEIKGESRLGEGSTFTVILHSEEASEPTSTTEEIEENNRRLITYNKTLKILVAEDNELNAEIIAEILKSEGFEVECAENGRVALEKFCASDEGEFDIILMDMQMPVMDGCTAAAEIRKLPRKDAKSVEIFACTANSFKEDRIKALESGMNDFLAKPINISEMLRKIGAGKSFVKEQNDWVI